MAVFWPQKTKYSPARTRSIPFAIANSVGKEPAKSMPCQLTLPAPTEVTVHGSPSAVAAPGTTSGCSYDAVPSAAQPNKLADKQTKQMQRFMELSSSALAEKCC
jgi:hypothetical protein